MAFQELKEKDFAIKFLAKQLIKGNLTLFLGAGTSKGFGLPNWLELVNALRVRSGLDQLDEATSAEDLQRGADDVLDELKDNQKLINQIGDILYEDKEDLDVKLAYENHLLIAISSLMIGSKRGHVSNVITLNYDSMLEWYLQLYGFMVNSIYEIPSLEGSEDVRIYHPHGYIPHSSISSKSSDFVILGLHDANKRLGNPSDPWFEKTRALLESSTCLFIGLSGQTLSDRVIAPLLASTGEKLKDKRPLGIWISKEELSGSKIKEFERNNIYPVVIQDVYDITEFILKISQEAMKMTLETVK
ncbi:MAG: hypothetical protein ED556_08165 [Winogradskyella sp.]|uniref:SIR2 family protein n=1 Tax=Winogradskyella sp. TaxID=1883156 RepID=UPI000F3CA7DA|nr:SIR2 family protein [Winogradskyella sp.]RNC86262.1 MAG: hypothetical protein ED556_08165 [Winogradskyella sp.]